MRAALLPTALVGALAHAAAACTPPSDALAAVAAYLSYESHAALWGSAPKRFSLAMADGDALFLQHELPRYFDERQRFVYAFRKGSRLVVAGCPNDPRLADCAERDLRESVHAPAGAAEPPIGASCDRTITFAAWRPSPDSSRKRRIASELLRELMDYGYSDPREVYVRDFNVRDPELDFYVIDQTGNGSIQGCSFDAKLRPHCAWHLYGMAPPGDIRREIMARPYKVFPPERRPAR